MYGKVYTFHGFLSPVSTYTIREPSNLFTIFVLMLIVIILSFVEWRHGWGMFCTCEGEDFTCTAKCTFFMAFWLLILHTSSLMAQTCSESLPLF